MKNGLAAGFLGTVPGTVASRPRMNGGDPNGTAVRKSSAPLLTIPDVAARCQCSPWTVRGWIDAGKLPVLRLPGRLVRIRPEDLEAFLEAASA